MYARAHACMHAGCTCTHLEAIETGGIVVAHSLGQPLAVAPFKFGREVEEHLTALNIAQVWQADGFMGEIPMKGKEGTCLSGVADLPKSAGKLAAAKKTLSAVV